MNKVYDAIMYNVLRIWLRVYYHEFYIPPFPPLGNEKMLSLHCQKNSPGYINHITINNTLNHTILEKVILELVTKKYINTLYLTSCWSYT